METTLEGILKNTMDSIMETWKKYAFISPSSFGFIVICFFMSFFTVQCSGSKVMSLDGTDFVFGKKINVDSNPMTMTTKVETMPPSIWAIIPFGLSLFGTGLYFIDIIDIKNKLKINLVISIIGAISLIFLRHSFKNQVQIENEGVGILTMGTQIGYYICFFGLIAIGVINIMLLREKKNIDAS